MQTHRSCPAKGGHALKIHEQAHEPIPRITMRNRPPHENNQYVTNSGSNHTNQNPNWLPETPGILKNGPAASAHDFRATHERAPKYDISHPTLAPKNLTLNKFSQTPRRNQNHQRISKNKLTSGYRKRLSGSRAIKQNVKCFPDFLFAILTASTPRLRRVLL